MNADSKLWTREQLGDPHEVEDKSARVQAMFDNIAPTYQRINRLASAGRDRDWRDALVAMAAVTSRDHVLDIACGTGDVAGVFRTHGVAHVAGADFSREMLLLSSHLQPTGCWSQADAQRLPFADAAFDVTSCAFGVRNFQRLELGLAEMYRVLRPGGRAMILEFAVPQLIGVRQLYLFYFNHVLPRLATWISRDQTGAYDYLPQSVATFSGPHELRQALAAVGFENIRIKRMTCGIVHLFRAEKP